MLGCFAGERRHWPSSWERRELEHQLQNDGLRIHQRISDRLLTTEGLLPVTQVALDDTWSALRFRFREEIPKIMRAGA